MLRREYTLEEEAAQWEMFFNSGANNSMPILETCSPESEEVEEEVTIPEYELGIPEPEPPEPNKEEWKQETYNDIETARKENKEMTNELLKNGGYTFLSSEMFQKAMIELSGNAFKVYMYMRSHSDNKTGEVKGKGTTLEGIAENTNISICTVKKAIKELKEKDYFLYREQLRKSKGSKAVTILRLFP